MRIRGRVILILAVLTLGSFWLAERLDEDETDADAGARPIPDYTMTKVNSLNMNAAGRPHSRLQAAYLEHFDSLGRTDLREPRLDLFRESGDTLHVRARHGRVNTGDDSVLLTGDVRFWRPAAEGPPVVELHTDRALVFPQREYAETDQPVTLTTRQTLTEGVGMRAWLEEQRIEILNQVRTRIEAGALSGGKP